ncbi:unnamed protein product [Parnassius apollo]|uniref:(apollo) hypothetical protein n=1 Tax=Parnassius apollo TaxID=110799 RepID=A0A8S3WLY1_PARAO|nr:unnamed protein product [Parnassius apollo]
MPIPYCAQDPDAFVRNSAKNYFTIKKMDRWANKTAVVTGASAGIGAAICVSLANAGLRVVGLARRADLVDNLKADVTGSGSIHSRKCDVSNVDEIRTTFKWVEDNFDGTDVLINNAGVAYTGHITDLDEGSLSDEQILATIDINLKGVVMCTRYAIASMKKRNFDGHVVNINSIAGHYIPFASYLNVYPSTKYAVTALTSSLLQELAEFKNNIKVTSISPGLVNTNIVNLDLIGAGVPMLQPADIADAVLYVLSTPPNVNISELTIGSVAEKKL